MKKIMLLMISLTIISAPFINESKPITKSNIYYKFKQETEIKTPILDTTQPIIMDTKIIYGNRVVISEYEYTLICRVVMSEASTEPYECKVAVAETIINRLLSERFSNTIEEIIFINNSYSTQNNGEPNQDCINAVTQAINQITFSESMVYFRTSHYHNFGVPNFCIGNTYFSSYK